MPPPLRLPSLRAVGRRLAGRPDELPAGDDLVVLEDGGLDGRLVCFADPEGAEAAAYRAWTAARLATRTEDRARLLLVTSTTAREEAPLVAANLAIGLAAARAGAVRLVDADPERPRLHRVFGVEAGPGLADRARAGRLPRGALRPGGLPELALLPAGSGGGATAEAIASVGRRLARSARWVLLAAPPVDLGPTSTALAPLVDGVVLVSDFDDRLAHRDDEARARLLEAGAAAIEVFVTPPRAPPAGHDGRHPSPSAEPPG